jgi:YesN/AraC family two-component response regulator
MKNEILHIESISRLADAFQLERPTHPLISLMDVSNWQYDKEWINKKITLGMYYVSIKDKSCGLEYGRNAYDFDEGVLLFAAPHQVITITQELNYNDIQGKVLFIHPDLIRNTSLGKSIDNYKFFSYDVHEALHLSDAEQKSIFECFAIIQEEIKGRIDHHSKTVISSAIELLLNFSNRYYERQFNTRSLQNIDVIGKFDALIKTYYTDGSFAESGIPSVEFFAKRLNFSANYLGDLLKKETGKSVKEHINLFIIEKAKTLLLNQPHTVSEIAYELGFNYPHYFSRMFKAQTGITPLEFRQQN